MRIVGVDQDAVAFVYIGSFSFGDDGTSSFQDQKDFDVVMHMGRAHPYRIDEDADVFHFVVFDDLILDHIFIIQKIARSSCEQGMNIIQWKSGERYNESR